MARRCAGSPLIDYPLTCVRSTRAAIQRRSGRTARRSSYARRSHRGPREAAELVTGVTTSVRHAVQRRASATPLLKSDWDSASGRRRVLQTSTPARAFDNAPD